MKNSLKSRLCITTLSAVLLAGTANVNASYAKPANAHHVSHSQNTQLDLGSPSLKQTENSQTLENGVTYTHIVRGTTSKHDYYTVDIGFFNTMNKAKATEKKVKDLGYKPHLRKIKNPTPKKSDIQEKSIGYVVQAGHFQNDQDAKKLADTLKGKGFSNASATFSAYDGTMNATGPWDIRVLEVNPSQFKGKIKPVLSNDHVVGKETVSSSVNAHHAIAGINGGYFVVGPTDGTPGDLAGISMLNGQLVSESVGNRTSLILTGQGAKIAKTSTESSFTTSDGEKHVIDGLNRKPGLIRSCGGTNDQPTTKPEQDVTCTDRSEIIEFNSRFGGEVPSGKGIDIVLNEKNEVMTIRNQRGGSIPKNGHVLSATGTKAEWLKKHIQIGDVLTLDHQIVINGKPVSSTQGMNIVNGGPHLLVNGKINIDAKEEGFDWSNKFYYHFGLYRQPRTLVGIKENGNVLFVTVDGRDPNKSIGVSFLESAKLMKSLGAVNAMNLDGGGSTTMVVKGHLVNTPSDLTGERPVGDALLLMPN